MLDPTGRGTGAVRRLMAIPEMKIAASPNDTASTTNGAPTASANSRTPSGGPATSMVSSRAPCNRPFAVSSAAGSTSSGTIASATAAATRSATHIIRRRLGHRSVSTPAIGPTRRKGRPPANQTAATASGSATRTAASSGRAPCRIPSPAPDTVAAYQSRRNGRPRPRPAGWLGPGRAAVSLAGSVSARAVLVMSGSPSGSRVCRASLPLAARSAGQPPTVAYRRAFGQDGRELVGGRVVEHRAERQFHTELPRRECRGQYRVRGGTTEVEEVVVRVDVVLEDRPPEADDVFDHGWGPVSLARYRRPLPNRHLSTHRTSPLAGQPAC